ncbi:MAG: ferrous iron transport protein A [Planctomycetota bacterium]
MNPSSNLPLSGLQPGTVCVVAQVLATDGISGRLMELGFVPGAIVRVVRRAPFGGPVQYRLHGVSITMRPADAAVVHVRMLADTCEFPAPARPGHRGRSERMELAGSL